MMRRLSVFGIVIALTVGLPSRSESQVEFRKPTWQDITYSRDGKPTEDSGPPKASNRVANPERDQNSLSARGKDRKKAKSQFGYASSSRESGPTPIVTRQNSFGIPFSVNSDAGPIREVQLHVSTNKGQSWSLHSRRFPNAKEFPFRAAADGEYWFAVQTIGTTIKEKKLEPELVIAIDSRKPNMNVSLKTDSLGRLVVNWRAVDENLDPKSIRLAYQTLPMWGRPSNRWQNVQLPLPNPSVETVYEDEIAFFADTSNISLDLRISIADKAGNISIVNRRYNLPRTALQSLRSAPVKNVATRIEGNAIRNNDSQIVGRSRGGSRPPSTDPYSRVTQEQKDNAARRVGMEASFDPGQTNAKRPRGGGDRVASSSNRKEGWQIQGNSGTAQDFNNNRPRPNEYASQNSPVPGRVNDPGFQNPSQFASSARAAEDAEEAFSRGSNLNRIPSGQYAKLSSSKKFELDYQVDHIQPDDISKLEIWYTEDAGESWALKTTDPDRQSPVMIDMDEDGIYGFRIRIQTVDGLESVQPGRGDGADVWVEVDTTKPNVRLNSIPYGRRRDAGKLIINWEATDRRLAAKPITLFYSVNLDGPWQIIVERLPNTGQFKWPVTDSVPRDVFIRVEAVDAAGNRNYHQTEQSIDLSGLNPRGMIRGVRPVK